MTKREMKKAYKKYAKENKTKGYMLSLIGDIICAVGCVIVLPVCVLSFLEKIDLWTLLTYIIPGVVILIVSIALNIFAEISKSKELKDFTKTLE